MASSAWAKYDYIHCDMKKVGEGEISNPYESPSKYWLQLYDDEELTQYVEWASNSYITDDIRLLTEKIHMEGNNYRFMGLGNDLYLFKGMLILSNIKGEIKGSCEAISKKIYEDELQSKRKRMEVLNEGALEIKTD